jgi:hypothetical protein
MSRSIHSTKKQRLQEQKHSHTDGIPLSDGMTELEREGIVKDIYKFNASIKKQAEKQDASSHAHLEIKAQSVAVRMRGRKQKGI